MRLRRRSVATAVAVILLLVLQGSAAPPAPAESAGEPQASTPATPPLVDGQLIVAREAGTDPERLASLLGARRTDSVPHRPDLQLLTVAAGEERALAAIAEQLPGVRWSAPNFVADAAEAPNDPAYRRQWHLGSRSRAAGAANWEPVHGTGVTGQGVMVAVIDTGVTANEDLDGVVAGYDFVDDDADPSDGQGHGTHIAGTVAQSTGNGVGVAGVAPDATVLALRALDSTGRGTYADILSSIALAVETGASVVNLSFAGGADGGLCEAVAQAVAAGAVVVSAAGNAAGPVTYPAACPSAIAVSATSIAAGITSYSNRGPEIELAAPGGDTSTDVDLDGAPDAILQYSVFNGVGKYYYSAGTSMAAPHVAGAAALLLDLDPAMSPSDVRSTLRSTALDLGTPGDDPLYGAGLLDIAAAVAAASEEPAPVPAPPSPGPAPGPAPDPEPEPETETETQPAPNTQPTSSRNASRISGAHRYATSVAVSRSGFQGGASRAFLASGRTFPDALAASALAAQLDAPVLLTEPCALPEVVGEELERLGVGEVVVIGGSGAVCEAVAVQAAVRARAPVRRISGGDRYETAAALAREGFETAGTVFVAAGHTFADSLPGGAAAAREGGPLLLTDRCRLPDATRQALERLQPSTVHVLGGQAAVCDAVLEAIGAELGGADIRRIAGIDRYATSAAAVTATFETSSAVLIASGTSFPDGLSGGALAAVLDIPLLLVPRCDVPSAIREAVAALEPERVAVLGGVAAICEDVRVELGRA